MSSQDSPKATNRQLYLRLLSYVRPYWKAFAVAIACMGLSSIVEPAFPALMKYLLDDGFAKAAGSWDWIKYPAAIFGIFLARAVVGFVADYSMNWVANNVILELRREMFAKLIRLPTQYYHDNASARLLTRVSHDVYGVSTAVTSAITTLVKDSVSVVGLLGWLFYLNWRLTLVTFVLMPCIAIAVKAFGKRMRFLARALQDSQGRVVHTLQEIIEGHKIIKIYGGQGYETHRFDRAAVEQRGLNMRVNIASAAQGPIVQFFIAAALAIIMGIALRQTSEGQATVGGFVSFITAMLMVMAPMKRLTDVYAPLQRGLVAAESVFYLIDQVPEKDEGKVELGKASGRVEFDRVSFTYPGTERLVLDEFSFAISPGESVALVGPSGSGKTTAANLLPRLYEVAGGEIRVDGHRLTDIRLESLRSNIALVSQDVVLFDDTIAANIAYGMEGKVTREAIEAAARAAHALEFIERLPEGLDTRIGERGVKLSGGQRQRLAIARALLKNAPILILDEATSALDNESERQVQAALDDLMVGRSTLIIAHRLSTIEGASRIITLSHGKKMEEGTHAELLARNGLYARLYRMQKSEEGAEPSPAEVGGNA